MRAMRVRSLLVKPNIPRKPIDQIRDSLKREAAAEARLQKLETEIKALKVALCAQSCRTPDEVPAFLTRLDSYAAEIAARTSAGTTESPEATAEFLQSLLAKAGPQKPDA
jgi:hypothetical protein